jgi:putative toxin-antitoxin system antitoxin component (TIGR02293 family)
MILVSAEQIAAVMKLRVVPHSIAKLDELVAKGLPKTALRESVDKVCETSEQRKRLLYQIVPEATYKRRKDLTPEESAKTERLARVFATARYIWGSEDDARAFLNAPHAMLQGRTPLEVSLTEIGARRVEELLWRLHYGIAA